MSESIKSVQDLYEVFTDELQNQKPELTDLSEGSINDVMAGVVAAGVNELITISIF